MDRTLDYLFNHIFLPRRLPHSSDSNYAAGDQTLIEHLARCARKFRGLNLPEHGENWSKICRTLEVFADLYGNQRSLASKTLQDTFRGLGAGETVILHIRLQNSALIVRNDGRHYHIESFETSAPAAEVLSAENALQWDFPGRAVQVPAAGFLEPAFQASLCDFLEKASIEPVKQFAAKTLKAGSNAYESRDTPSPAVIGQLLMAILEVNGIKASVISTRKRVQDDVCWSDGAENPWRRSPVWLVLRVGVQRCLVHLFDGLFGTFQYKAFVCFAMAELCWQLSSHTMSSLDRLSFVRKRLGRRAAKLQQWKHSEQLEVACQRVLTSTETCYREVLQLMSEKLERDWNIIRARVTKHVKLLPRRADPQSMTLSLLHSRPLLFGILDEALYRKPLRQPHLEHRYRRVLQHSTWTTRQMSNVQSFTDYLDLADEENRLQATIATPFNMEQGCDDLLSEMRQYLVVAREAYQKDAVQSSLMLLLLMELWQALDTSIIAHYPLLAEYDTGFPSNLLHVLQLARIEDMQRLQAVEKYLEDRSFRASSHLPGVFEDIERCSFQVRYYENCPAMQDHRMHIELINEAKKTRKGNEWNEKCKEYENLAKEALTTPCLFIIDPVDLSQREHDDKHCRKCYLNRKKDRIAIDIHENLLPDDEVQAKALIFELCLPEGFGAWRDATWLLLRLGDSNVVPQQGTRIRLPDIPGIKELIRSPIMRYSIGLASRKKSFYDTHYRSSRFPVTLDNIHLPHGPRYGLYNHLSQLWTSNIKAKASFANVCTPFIPPKSMYSRIRYCVHPIFESEAMTSNSIIASQTKCPNTLSVAEFTAFQDLRQGNSIQWIRLARELASSNLNFGSIEVYALVAELALMAGPPHGSILLRANHWFLGDKRLGLRLALQIKLRIEAIATNWREGQTLQCLILLLERLWSLSPSSEVKLEFTNLLQLVRSIAHSWIKALRREMSAASDAETAQKRSTNAFLAALLCRRTFLTEVTETRKVIQADDLVCFLECAFTLKDNLPSRDVGQIAKLPLPLRSLYIHDIKLLRSMEAKLRDSINKMQLAVSQAVNNVLGDTDKEARRAFTPWTFLHSGWVTAHSIATNGLAAQQFHFEIFEGTLLVDGEPIGRLPDEYSKQAFFQQSFGSRVFLTAPSGMPGMSYMLVSRIEGHQVHFGVRNGGPIMRAISPDRPPRMLEFIPPTAFHPKGSMDIPDLPWPLIQGHIHWLDISHRTVIVRPAEHMWRSRPGDWILNLETLQASRPNKPTLLVDPRSATFASIVSIFEPFENRKGLVIFQPRSVNLRLKLPALELSFKVNGEGLLESDQLGAMIDPNQDAGTLYGMASSLVLRDRVNPDERSILVAMGDSSVMQQGNHTTVSIVHNGYYARFRINKLLGRLECACEPRLVYFKAYCHAVTSSTMSDPLTGKLGTEEALRCLNAGNAQPWTPFDEAAQKTLQLITDLTPRRNYYPKDLKLLQKVVWKDNLSSAAQHEDFRGAVGTILGQCGELQRFNQQGSSPMTIDSGGDNHLLKRAQYRNNKFCPNQNFRGTSSSPDKEYEARDTPNSLAMQYAFQAASLIRDWSKDINVATNLALIFEGMPTIQGFGNEFGSHLLGDLLQTDVAYHWGSLFSLCQAASKDEDRHRLLFIFATMAFGRCADMVLVRTLIAIAIFQDFENVILPQSATFDHFRIGEVPTEGLLTSMTRPFRVPYPPDERSVLSYPMQSKHRHRLEIAQLKHEEKLEESCKTFVRHLIRQWPVREPTTDGLGPLLLFDVDSALASLMEEWDRMFRNYEFREHILTVQQMLNKIKGVAITGAIPSEQGSRKFHPLPTITLFLPSIEDLTVAASQSLNPLSHSQIVTECLDQAANGLTSDLGSSRPLVAIRTQQSSQQSESASTQSIISDLQAIVGELTSKDDRIRQEYGEDLQRSLNAHVRAESSRSGRSIEGTQQIDRAKLCSRTKRFQTAVHEQFKTLCAVLSQSCSELKASALLPDLTPSSLLEMLNTFTHGVQTKTLIDPIVVYGELVRNLQHLLRIASALARNDPIQLADELREDRAARSHAFLNMDWLLLEIDFDLRIRNDQYQVARALITPESKSNSVLQMNMGQGKSSVIIPMIVAQLADTKSLVRVIVPRPLLQQTAHLIHGRLGGLIGRRVKHVPFSRKSSTDAKRMESYYKIHLDILQRRGVILTLPEHALSFHLSGLQELSNGHNAQAGYMMQIQSWFRRKCRDILDECDHMLAVKTQLIYPSGAQSTVDGHPNRWIVAQQLLKLTKTLLPKLQHEFPSNLEVIQRAPGTFPTIYILHSDVRDALLQRLSDSVLNTGAGILPIDTIPPEDMASLEAFICNTQIPKAVASQIGQIFKAKTDSRNQMLLLRGLLIHRILVLGLSKRWNVQYGIHPQRDPIAVPFRSKGVPSDQAEFGHPDVSIVLTCLSFYYSGISLAQFQQTLMHLLRSDEPVREFTTWYQAIHNFPDSLRAWNSINVEDEAQTIELWNLLRLQMPVVNYFLNHFVFPCHARTFKKKLVSSGWDIAMPAQISSTQTNKENVRPNSEQSRGKLPSSACLTVGFSGTNDNKVLLPLNIKQNDLTELSQTNAEVLAYLLQPRNRKYVRVADRYGKRISEPDFLSMLKRMQIRMLLDAGAQILELDNVSLVRKWLELDTEADAGVFFGADNRARVIFRDGKQQPLSVSPFVDNLGACVVYLDEAHTRGVDLKMPADARAALTLGIMQTKDHTVQAAMRLRRLAISQSIIFFAPPEVHQSILNLRQKSERQIIDSYDVIAWLLEQTCCNIEQLQPLYISQGLDFCRRQVSSRQNSKAASDEEQRRQYLRILEQPENYSLEQLYSPDHKVKAVSSKTGGYPELEGYVAELNERKRSLRDTGDTVQALAHTEVEQEREVEIEVETVREVKKPQHAQPLSQPPLDRAVRVFAETGRMIAGSQAYTQAFVALSTTAIGRRLRVDDSATQSRIYVTQDFGNTVVRQHTRPQDEFCRPVHWVLWSVIIDTALILSDFEADAILPLIRNKKHPCTHLLTYSAPVSRNMLMFDTLDFYTVPALPDGWQAPPWLVRDLGIFAGRLYFDYETQCGLVYEAMGLPPIIERPGSSHKEPTEMDLWQELAFDDEQEMKEMGGPAKPFSPNALLFMQEWLAVRRKGQDFSQTMMGEICRGRRVVQDDPDT